MPGTAPSSAGGSNIAVRAILLALLLAAANLWAIRHLGFGLEDPIGLLGLTGGVAAFSFVLDYLIGKDEQEEVAQPIKTAIQRFLRTWVLATPTLVLLYLLCGIAACLFSSITIVGPASGTAVEIVVAALDDPAAKRPITVAPGAVAGPYVFLANPFGRELRLSPAGYSAETKTLLPLTGLTLSLDDDFEPLPTLLLRPGLSAWYGLKNGGQYVVWKKDEKGCTELAKSEPDAAGRAVLLGVGRPVPSNLVALWGLELQSAGITSTAFAEAMLAWQKPKPLPLAELLPAGTVLNVGVQIHGNLIGFADFTVGKEPFQDVLLTDPAKYPRPADSCGG